MYVHFKCSKCGKHLEVDEKGAGMSVPCTDCGTSMTVPNSTTRHTCPQCHISVLVDDILKGASFECSTCRQMLHIPSPNDKTDHRCPFCHIAVSVPASMRGCFTQCPNCRQQFLVPGSSLHFQHQEESAPQSRSKPERLDLLTKASQWEKRAKDAMQAGGSMAVHQTWSNKMNRIGGRIAGIPMLVGFTMSVFGFVLGIPSLADIGGTIFASSVVIGLVLGVVYIVGLCITHLFKVISVVAACTALFLVFSNDGFRNWFISAFKFDTQQTVEATASSVELPQTKKQITPATFPNPRMTLNIPTIGMEFAGFRLGESARDVVQRLSSHVMHLEEDSAGQWLIVDRIGYENPDEDRARLGIYDGRVKSIQLPIKGNIPLIRAFLNKSHPNIAMGEDSTYAVAAIEGANVAIEISESGYDRAESARTKAVGLLEGALNGTGNMDEMLDYRDRYISGMQSARQDISRTVYVTYTYTEMSEGNSERVKEKAADSPDDLLAHARVLVGSNDPAAIPLLEKASRKGSSDSSFELARIYAKGLCGATTNENSMEQWLSVAQKQGHIRAGSMLQRRQEHTQRLNKTWRKYWDGESFSADQYLSADEIERGKKEIAVALNECTEASSWTRKQAQHHLDYTMACKMKTVGTGARSSGPSRQPRVDSIRPSGSPPRWQVREGQTRPDGVRTFNENQYIARHDGRYGGAFSTPQAAANRAEELNTQQEYNSEAMGEMALNSGQDSVYMLNSRAGNWTYKYDASINAFVVYQE